MRIVMTIGVILLVIVVGGVALIYAFRDPLLRLGIEQIASDASGAAVTIGDLETRLADGAVQVTDFTVANPGAFTPGVNALEIPVMTLTIAPEQPTETTALSFDEVALIDPVIRYETNGSGVLNLDVLARSLEQYDVQAGGGEQYLIDRLEVDQGTVILVDAGGDERPTTLPAFSVDGLGYDEGGLSGTALSARVLDELSSKAAALAQSRSF